MNSKLVKVLGAICGGLLLVIGGEWFYASVSQQELLNTQIPKDNKPLADAMPTINLTEHDEESYGDLVNRPLFIEGRKPVNEPPPETVKGPAVTVNFDWVLKGIVYSRKSGLLALLTRPATVKSPKASNNRTQIRLGAILDGWRLAEVTADYVVFTLDTDQKQLFLHKAKPKTPARSGNATPPPGVQPEGTPPEGTPPEGVPPPAPEQQPEDLMPEPESPEDLIENSENE
ncbi:hypothetical protein [Methylovulum psychrotolerans]|jgi:hypothetical protein|uniref:Type II secretion system protein GspC N-terminal domain-containing protein n=1 Tax=Methylovulum psychrotolerans TaxID=1704499 RepID=A0A2S5CRZ4_9GAMM|nr:hypothetical protein [Methylovulum psychrotolerans]MBT9097422.1 hypothetical protein [Methylovulum psychrotolerans]POZ53517.1 hypothetical protein AADEFJLK_00544 [Methylovulum psychrotolerans]